MTYVELIKMREGFQECKEALSYCCVLKEQFDSLWGDLRRLVLFSTL